MTLTSTNCIPEQYSSNSADSLSELPFCKYTAHERCVNKVPDNCIQTYAKTTRDLTSGMKHWWIRGNKAGPCDKCKKQIKYPGMAAKVCRWCQITVHEKCSKELPDECGLGKMRPHILPPWTICPGVLNDQKTKSRINSSADVTHFEPPDFAKPVTRMNSLSWEGQGLQINPLPGTQPLLVFINPKSGGKQGVRLMRKMQSLLNPRQVYDLSNGGPMPGLNFFHDLDNFRVLCCGGDGTVGWVLDSIDKCQLQHHPPVAILPLGTGNDLARCMRWGGGLLAGIRKTVWRVDGAHFLVIAPGQHGFIEEISQRLRSVGNTISDLAGYEGRNIVKFLQQIEQSQSIMMDRWSLNITPNPNQTEQGDPVPLSIINNYFSIGVDASICRKFHMMREKHPEKFNSRMKNKLWYSAFGTTETFAASCKKLYDYLDITVDGKPLESWSRGHFQGIAILNIPSVYGGTNLWGPTKKQKLKQKDSDTSKIPDIKYAVQELGDQKLEIVGVEGAMEVGQIITGLKTGKRLAQGSEIVITTTKLFPMQVDGEPWLQIPCKIHINHKNQVPMLMAPSTGQTSFFSRFRRTSVNGEV